MFYSVALTIGYVVAFSAANLSGRLGWASLSDVIGRKNMFYVFTCASIPMFLSIPMCTNALTTGSAMVPLVVFYGTSMLIISMFGGTYSTIPAYESDLFGSKYIGAIHGRMLTASSFAGVVGPMAVSTLRKTSETNAITDLVQKCNPQVFADTFGASVDQLQSLAKAKTVTISKLMEIVPSGTLDPTPYLYDTTMYTMTGFVCLAAVSNFLIRPVPSKYHEVIDTQTKDTTSSSKLRENVKT